MNLYILFNSFSQEGIILTNPAKFGPKYKFTLTIIYLGFQFLIVFHSILNTFPISLMQTKTDNSLSQFKLFKRFHLFYYSRKDGQTHFLLRQKKEGFFSAIKGRLETHDPAILFSVGRKIMEMSSGLLTQQNMELFAENSAYTIVNKDMIQFCRPRQQMVNL